MAVDVVAQANQDAAAWEASKRAATERAKTSSTTGVDGNAVTTSVSNDTLSNNDFMKLMLEELKQQDPTKPQDSAAIMDSQLKMSTIQSNQDMGNAMKALQTSYGNSALSTAANMIGHSITNGNKDDSGNDKVYRVFTVENRDGELYVNAQERIGFIDALKDTTDNDRIVNYNRDNGTLYDKDNKETEYKISLDGDGRFKRNKDGSIIIVDKDNVKVTDKEITEKYIFAGTANDYSKEFTDIPLSSVKAVS